MRARMGGHWWSYENQRVTNESYDDQFLTVFYLFCRMARKAANSTDKTPEKLTVEDPPLCKDSSYQR